MYISTCCCLPANRVFQFAGYIPGLSSITGLFRMCIGVIEIVAGLILTAVGCSYNHVTFVIDGAQEILRGAIETLPILGNIALFAYDIFSAF